MDYVAQEFLVLKSVRSTAYVLESAQGHVVRRAMLCITIKMKVLQLFFSKYLRSECNYVDI